MYAPRFQITNTILKNIGIIEAAREVVENSPIVPSYEKQFQTDAIIRTVHHGTHIEGNDLTLIQTKKVLEGSEVVARPRDVQEVINYRNTVKLLDDLSKNSSPYSISDLLAIHIATVDKIVAPEKVGRLRTTQVVIKEEGTGKIIFQPPSYVEVPYLLEDFFSWLNNASTSQDIHPVLKAGIAHYVLVAIHPFVEGNGRTSRAFANLVMLKEGYDTKKFFALEEHFDEDLEKYYAAFSVVDKLSINIAERDLTTWLEYFTEVVAIELAKIKEKVRKISIDTRLKIKMGNQIALSERQMRLVEYLSDQKQASMKELIRLIPMISEDTILRDLKDLMDKGIIKKEGRTKSARYVMVKG